MKTLFSGLEQKSMRAGLMLGEVSSIEVAKITGGGYTFKGVATGTSIVDRMRRVFLPGAFEPLPAQVPLLAFHNDRQPVGISKFTQQGSLVRHDSQLSNIEYAAELEQLIKDGAIPATSIGWTSDEMYWGIQELRDQAPQLIEVLEKNGIPQEADIIYFAKADILENSLTPIPANPIALISVASLMGGRERGMVESMFELQKAAFSAQKPASVQTPLDFSVATQLAEKVRTMFIMSFPGRRAKYSDEEFEAAFDQNSHEMLDLTTDILRAGVNPPAPVIPEVPEVPEAPVEPPADPSAEQVEDKAETPQEPEEGMEGLDLGTLDSLGQELASLETLA